MNDRYLAMAIDGEGSPVDAVGSNMGHVLGTGVLHRDQEASVIDRLARSDMSGPFGIATMSRDNPSYNPIGYHTGSVWTHDTAICALGMVRAGDSRHAAAVVRALVEVGTAFDYRWPELYSGDPVLRRPAPYPASCRPQAWSAASAGAIVSAVLGLDIDVPAGRVSVRPMRPSPFGGVRVDGLRFGPQSFSVSVTALGEVSVDGLPPGIDVIT